MSVAGVSRVSSRPTSSTVVGCRDLDVTSNVSNRTATTTTAETKDETFKREKCTWFERQLKISKYLRDKKNEERLDYDTFIRINSKRLRCSYHIPAADIYGVLKRLHKLLAPGLRAESEKKSAGRGVITEKGEKSLKILHNWITCSDLTVQVFPKTPTVLWLDLECMACKKGEQRKTQRHIRSKKIIETVVRVVTDFTDGSAETTGNSDVLYVTRGKTCGMHLFFPYVTFHSEDDVQELWAAVNRRLVETDQTTATVDTGCSAMPLPLSRDHNGLTRVEVKRSGGTDGEQITIQSYQLTTPSVKDFARVTNFHHIVADSLKEQTPSPPSSYISSASTTDVSKVSNKRKRDKSETVVGSSQPDTEHSLEIKKAKLEDEHTDTNYPSHDTPAKKRGTFTDEATDEGVVSSETGEQSLSTTTKHLLGVDDAFLNCEDDEFLTSALESCDEPANESTHENVTRHDEEEDERASNFSSSSSKRLVQVDIRAICAKAGETKRKKSLIKDSPDDEEEEKLSMVSSKKRQRITILDDEDDSDEEVKGTNERDDKDSLVSRVSRSKNNGNARSPTVEDGFNTEVGDDAASSFLCRGYTPSAKSSRVCPNSLLLTTEDELEDDCKSVTGRVRKKEAMKKTAPPPTLARDCLSDVTQEQQPSSSTSNAQALFQLSRVLDNITEDTLPGDARLPDLLLTADNKSKPRNATDAHNAKEAFANSMKLRLDSRQNPVHETDTQLITSIFNTEVDFYQSMLKNATPVAGSNGLRVKSGCSLNASRENCPSGLFQEYVPRVLYAEDFVSETEWMVVLIRYFDEYLNSAPFLYVMSHVLENDENVIKQIGEATRLVIHRATQNCLSRFKSDKRKKSEASYIPKHPYDEKCTVVSGLVAVCSLAFNIVTPVFTDLAKICRSMLGNSQQTAETLNASTMPTTSNDGSYDSTQQDDSFFDESASQVGYNTKRFVDDDDRACDAGGAVGRQQNQEEEGGGGGANKDIISTNIGNDHSVIASILRWHYSALADQTVWCLFFYYYHVHADGLARIMNEVVHGGLMVTAVLQAYFEIFANNAPVDMGLVCRQMFNLNNKLRSGGKKQHDEDHQLMPPPKGRTTGQKTKKKGAKTGGGTSFEDDEKRQQFEKRNHNSKQAQRKVQQGRNSRLEDDDDEEDGETAGDGEGGNKNENYAYKTDFCEVLSLIVNRYWRPVAFDETKVVYTETGYEERNSEFSSYFSSCNKQIKATVKETFDRALLKYSMPHGDLAMFNTDVMGTVHRRSSCTNNLVLNIFENMYGGCMTYLTRRYNNNLKLFNRFNGDAYRLVVECRHASKEFIQSIELSYINLILRQPVVPPVLESDIAIRHMFMSREEITKGAFVCLNAMDYVRAINMFTRHSKFPQENCRIAESFLDKVITNEGMRCDAGNEDARMRFRTAYLFFLLYIFEVLYKIRHAYNRDRTYYVSIERLSWDMDVRLLLKLFFGAREFKMPRGLPADALDQLDMPTDLYDECASAAGAGQYYYNDDDFKTDAENKAAAARCINTRPTVSTVLPAKQDRMIELFKKKGIVIMKSYAPRCGEFNETGQQRTDRSEKEQDRSAAAAAAAVNGQNVSTYAVFDDREDSTDRSSQGGLLYEERDRAFLDMTQAKLEEELYSSANWYENCRVRMKAVARIQEVEKKMNELEMCMDAVSMDTFLRTQLRVNVDNDRLNHIDRAVRENRDFAFCTHMPLRTKMMALVLATHAMKRMSAEVATDFVRKEYRLERSGVVRFAKTVRTFDGRGRDPLDESAMDATDNEDTRPDMAWEKTWNQLLGKRRCLLMYCRSLADTDFPDSYFIGLHPDDSYNALYNYMLAKPQYTTLHGLQDLPWAKDVCVAMNFLLVMNAYDTELVELCLRLFLSFEWPGQWAKRIFVWKSNSNAGKSFFFESIISKAFENATSINDPKGGKDNAPEKSEYYKNFLLMINEFTTASSCELKKLCSTSGYKFRMNFGNQMIQAYMVGKMVFNCNTLPLTTDHATIQRVALIPLPFWFHKRQSVVDSLLNWTRGQSPSGEYEKNFRRKISKILTTNERQFFIDHTETKNENDLFNEPDENTLQLYNQVSGQKTGASMFLVQNKTSQVYMSSSPATGTIISGIMLITRYFCRFRYFNKIKEPVDFSSIPTACTVAAQEWERFSQPYYEWKERYRVEKDNSVRTKVSVIHASLSHFAKNYSKTTSFFDLRQFFEVDFVDNKISYYHTNKEDEYNIRLDPPQD